MDETEGVVRMTDTKNVLTELGLLKLYHTEIVEESKDGSIIKVHEGCLVAINHAITAIEDMEERIAIMIEGQETVKPTLIRGGRIKNYNDYVCPRCDNEVVYEQNYCSECGVRFLWEGR